MSYPSTSHQVSEHEEQGKSSSVGHRVQSSEKKPKRHAGGVTNFEVAKWSLRLYSSRITLALMCQLFTRLIEDVFCADHMFLDYLYCKYL